MEVPCCSGLTAIAKQALDFSQKDIPMKEVAAHQGRHKKGLIFRG